jgi:uncharacterized membrane protein
MELEQSGVYTVFLALAFLIGIVAGLRTMTALAAASWAAYLGGIVPPGSSLTFLGYAWTPWILSIAACAELAKDKLPTTASRKAPFGFSLRIIVGAIGGEVLSVAQGAWMTGMLFGVAGAVAGTFAGASVRGRLAAAFGRDLPAALVEDVVAILAAVVIVYLAIL